MAALAGLFLAALLAPEAMAGFPARRASLLNLQV